LRRLAALILLILSACAAPRTRQKMSFDELYAGSARPPADAAAKGSSRNGSASARFSAEKKFVPKVMAPDSPVLRAAMRSFTTQARSTRAQVVQGSPMPPEQVANWKQMNAALDTFLREPARKTSSLDVVRARVSLEAELEEDARTYGDIPSDLADAVLARMQLLEVRMAELRRLQLKPKRPRFTWPVDPAIVTSVFGSRWHPILGEEREHQGLDLAAKSGQLVTAAAGGVVVKAGWNGGHGNQVVIQHDGNITTRYSHLSRLLVTPGEVLEQGDVVGAAGKTGMATGVHLHFELWRNGEPSDPLDELGPTESGEEPTFARHGSSSGAEKREGRRPVGRRPQK
jgi:murein DD-endopeptidase MepM/ murein hydrolase activator NlpD